MSLVDVLPVDPVIPTTLAPERRRTSRATRPRATSGSVTSIARSTAVPASAQHGDRAGGHRRGGEVRPVHPAAGEGDEQVSRAHRSRVDRDAAHGRIHRRGAAGRGPRSPASRARSSAAASDSRASRATVRSSKGRVRSANCCPCSWPLPAITTTSPGPASASASPMARAAVELDLHIEPAGDLGGDGRRILAAGVVGGDDRRGRPAGGRRRPSAAAFRDRGRRRSRTRRSARPAVISLAEREHVLERVGRVRIVDQHRERLAGVDRLEPSGHAGDVGDAGPDRVVVELAAPRQRRPRRARSRR